MSALNHNCIHLFAILRACTFVMMVAVVDSVGVYIGPENDRLSF